MIISFSIYEKFCEIFHSCYLTELFAYLKFSISKANTPYSEISYNE